MSDLCRIYVEFMPVVVVLVILVVVVVFPRGLEEAELFGHHRVLSGVAGVRSAVLPLRQHTLAAGQRLGRRPRDRCALGPGRPKIYKQKQKTCRMSKKDN